MTAIQNGETSVTIEAERAMTAIVMAIVEIYKRIIMIKILKIQ